MSRHIDLIAVAVLLLAFAVAARLHEVAQLSAVHTRMFRLRPISPVVIVAPHAPAVPRFPRLPRVQY
jgi:hypothetical protein